MRRDTLEKRVKIANHIMYYIYTHIDTHIDLEDLSYDLNISKFHMHRIFKEAFEKNIYECIKSIRLQKAANLLLTNKYSTISNIALLCGYSSHSSFIKAFSKRFEMSPKLWRNGGYKEYSKRNINQLKKTMNSTAYFSNLPYSIVKMPEIKSYYIRNKGYNRDIKQAWQKLQTLILNNDIKEYKQIALLHDNPVITPLKQCQYIACIQTQEKEEILSQKLPKFKISSGVYAKFDLKGHQGDILRFIKWVYHKWLLNSDYDTTTKPSYIIYHKNNFLSNDDEFDMSFYVSIDY